MAQALLKSQNHQPPRRGCIAIAVCYDLLSLRGGSTEAISHVEWIASLAARNDDTLKGNAVPPLCQPRHAATAVESVFKNGVVHQKMI